MEQKDYYKILGLERNATQDEIKKKYKKLALKFHPDKMVGKSETEQKEAEEKFKEINEAYSILSDETKRRQYDQFGTIDGKVPNFGDFSGFGGMDDVFKTAYNFFRGGRSNHEQQFVEKGDDVEITIKITLQDSLKGCHKKIKYKRNVPCSHCNGTGSADGKEHTCPTCGGSGIINKISQRGSMLLTEQMYCQDCNGKGKKITNKCNYCGGTGFENIEDITEFDVPKGVFNGIRFTVQGKGSDPLTKNGVRGDLLVNIVIIPDERFIVNPNNPSEVIQKIHLTLYEALCGCEKIIDCVDGSKVKITIPELTNDGKVFNLRGKGLPDIRQENYIGDMKVVIVYKLPNKLNKDQKETLKKYFNN